MERNKVRMDIMYISMAIIIKESGTMIRKMDMESI